MKKITFFLGSLGRGGAERVISNLSQDYARRGWETNICLLLSYKVQYPLDTSTDVIDLTGGTASRTLRIPYWVKEIRQFIKVEKPDYIIAFAARINILVLLACIGLDTRIIISERNDPRFDGRGRIVNFLTMLLYPRAHCLVFQTKRAQEYFSERIKKKSCVIPNPVTIDQVVSSIKEKKIVNVGRLTPQKNQKLLLSAFARIVTYHKDYILEIYGSGELRNDLINHSKELGIYDHVFLKGIVSNIHECISNAEIFVLTSNYEGLSNALLEAMMMGLPCISTNCSGIAEYIDDGVNGILVPISDEDSLVNALNRLINNPKLRENIAQTASTSMKSLSSCCINNRWKELTE